MPTSAYPAPPHGGHRRSPWLVCLDLQREYVVPGRPHYQPEAIEVVRTCARVLDIARTCDWRIVHCQMRRETSAFPQRDHFSAPIEGLRPLIYEPVYLRDGLSAFSNPDFAAKVGEARGDDVYLIGFSLADTCLATAFGAVDHRITLTLVEDAVGVGAAIDLSTSQIARSLLRPHVRLTTSAELHASTAEYAQ